LLGKSLFFLLGLCSLFLIQTSSHLIYWLWLSFAFLIVSIVFSFNNKNHFNIPYLACGLIWSVATVFFWDHVDKKLVNSPVKVRLTGSVCGIPNNPGANSEQKTYSQIRFEFCVDSIEDSKVSVFSTNRVIASWRNYSGNPLPVVKSGQTWSFEGKLKPVHGRSNPGNFDFERWMVSNGIAGTFSIKQGEQLESSMTLANRYREFRQNLYDKIVKTASSKSSTNNEAESNLGLVLAISMGEKNLINEGQWKAFKETGTSHLLAISGLHIGIAALWSYWLVSFFWRLSNRLCLALPAQTAGQFASLLGALTLLFASGIGLPALRATLMLSLFIVSRLYYTSMSLSRVLGITVFLVSITSPLSILSASFWLSFFAVFVISIVVNRQYHEMNKLMAWFKVNWFLYLLLIPVTLLFFGYFNIASIVANLVLIPLVSFVITPLCFVTVLVISVNQYIGELLLFPLDFTMSLMVSFQKWLSSISILGVSVQLELISVLLLFMAISVWILPRKLVPPLISFPALLIVFVLHFQSKTKAEFEAFVFDIGQGLAIYVENEKGNLLYDTGWGSQDFSLAQSVLIPFFESRNISELDKLIISHGDSDHAGGIEHIKEKLNISMVISGEPIPNISSESCHKPMNWFWDTTSFEFIQHINKRSVSGNNASCVLSIQSGGYRILLTGDIEKSAEKRLIKRGLDDFHIVVAPHHGSKTSSTMNFVKKTKPQHVIFSAGYANQWSFPRVEVVERYISVGSKVWTTHTDGAVRIRISEENGLEVNSWRRISPNFWSESKMRSIITK